MTLENRVEAFAELGTVIDNLCSSNFDDESHPFRQTLIKACAKNAWFTKENQLVALKAISGMLDKEKLLKWISAYPNLKSQISNLKSIGLILAGNIPAVGFHDLLCVLMSGNSVKAKLSSDDSVILPWLAKLLTETEPGFSEKISFTEKVSGVDAVIATGSNNSARYFEYYFSKVPHIIRKNRNAVAVLSGNENENDLKNLGADIFSYFGLGCRNVSKLYVPAGFDFSLFFKAIESFSAIMQHNKYMNNYDFHRVLFLMNSEKFLTNNFLIVKEDKMISTPVSVLNYETFTDLSSLKKELEQQKEKIQCVVSAETKIENAVPFGKAQQPELWDYADGVDTMRFLEGLHPAGA